MLWHGWACRISRLNEDHAASALAVLDPAGRLKGPYCPLARNNRQSGDLDGDLYLSDFDGQRRTVSGTCFRTTGDGFADVAEESFGFSASLRNAAGNRRALRDEHPGFVRLESHKELHAWILPQLGGRQSYCMGARHENYGCRVFSFWYRSERMHTCRLSFPWISLPAESTWAKPNRANSRLRTGRRGEQ